MIKVKLTVRAIVHPQAIEFEKEVEAAQPPYVWMPLAEGRLGERSPLFLSEVRWSAVFGCYLCRCEPDLADDVESAAELVGAYERAGWRETTRVNLYDCPLREAS